MYEMLVGSIGHDTLLHKLKFWQIRAAIRGQYRRDHSNFEAARLLGWWVLNALGCKDLDRLSDLTEFPWEKKGGDIERMPTAEEIAEMQREMAEYNAKVREGQ